MSRFDALAAISCLVAAGACGAGVDEQAPDRWRLVGAPSLQIGELDGESSYLFQRIASAHFASGSRVVVADAGAKVLRVFDSSGRFLRQIGRGGEGPGEFAELRDAWMVTPDTIGVWDSRASRLSYFTVDGVLTGTALVRPPADLPGSLDLLAGALPDGSVVIGAIQADVSQDPHGRPDRVHLARFDREGRFLGVIAVVDGLVRAQQGRMFGPIPFSPFPSLGWPGHVIRAAALIAGGSLQSALIGGERRFC